MSDESTAYRRNPLNPRARFSAELTVQQAAILCGRPASTLRDWIASGELPARKVDGRNLISLKALRDSERFGGAYRPKEVAELLDLSAQTIYRRIRRGEIRAHVQSGQYFVGTGEMFRILEEAGT